jgi:GR25 family glycosyltransferase involved in LPS biosynthesis
MEYIYNQPCFVINLDRSKDRLETTIPRISEAGFKNINRVVGVDGKNQNELNDAWNVLKNPKFDPDDSEFVTYPGKQGCYLSHLNIWKYIIDNKIGVSTVLEDDVLFHKNWKQLAEAYIVATPNDYDILYIGSQMDFITNTHISKVPVFCTHSYIITLQGATKLYNLLINRMPKTIDCILIEYMSDYLNKKIEEPFIWYVWNAHSFPDEFRDTDIHWKKRNYGLVFQDHRFESEVRIWNK